MSPHAKKSENPSKDDRKEGALIADAMFFYRADHISCPFRPSGATSARFARPENKKASPFGEAFFA
jgi:hypothetical protein